MARSILVAAVAASVAFLAIARPWGRPSPAPRSLTGAMAKATSASLDLAREASAPAARIGRNVLAAGVPGEIAWPSSDNAPAVLASIGRRVGDGVRPLSGSARKAFGFLALPTSDRKTARPEG